VVDVSAAAAGDLAQRHGAKVVDADAALKDAAVKAWSSLPAPTRMPS